MQIIMELYSVRTETAFERKIMEALAVLEKKQPNKLAIKTMQSNLSRKIYYCMSCNIRTENERIIGSPVLQIFLSLKSLYRLRLYLVVVYITNVIR